jgi:subtilisin family serine protease
VHTRLRRLIVIAGLMLAPVLSGQAASRTPSSDQWTLPDLRVSRPVNLDRSRESSFDLAPSVIVTSYLPIVMGNYCSSSTITDPAFESYQSDMRQINADDAWLQCAQGDPSVIVAVIDTGVSLSHPDLAPNLISGASFVPYEPSVEDGEGHGSNVAGIVGASLNGIGVVGVAPRTRLLPVKVLDSDGSGYNSWVANGVIYAADHSAKILNLSLGGPEDDQVLRDAINYAADTKNTLVIAAAGNCGDYNYQYNGCSYMNQPAYPAAYSNVIAVAAVTWWDTRVSFSNVGDYVDIAAPGVSIYNTYKNGSYAYESGTSQATPHVAGLAALIWARYPKYTAAQVRALIQNTAVDLGATGWDAQFGWGRIDARAALNLASSNAAPVVTAGANRIELQPPKDHRDADIAPGRVLIKFQPGYTTASISRALSVLSAVSIEGQIKTLNVQVLHVPVGQEWLLIDQLRALPGVEYVEPDYAVRLIR